MRKVLLMDVDEVLCDFQTPMFEALYNLYGRRASSMDCQVWDCFSIMSEHEVRGVFSAISHPGWCRELKPTPGSQAAVEKLRGLVDIVAVTSPFGPSRTWVHERDAWLKDLFGFTGKDIVHTSLKYLVRGDAFLDDCPSHVTGWLQQNPDKLAMLWAIPNTRLLPYDDIRVTGWDEVIKRVTAMIGKS